MADAPGTTDEAAAVSAQLCLLQNWIQEQQCPCAAQLRSVVLFLGARAAEASAHSRGGGEPAEAEAVHNIYTALLGALNIADVDTRLLVQDILQQVLDHVHPEIVCGAALVYLEQHVGEVARCERLHGFCAALAGAAAAAAYVRQVVRERVAACLPHAVRVLCEHGSERDIQRVTDDVAFALEHTADCLSGSAIAAFVAACAPARSGSVAHARRRGALLARLCVWSTSRARSAEVSQAIVQHVSRMELDTCYACLSVFLAELPAVFADANGAGLAVGALALRDGQGVDVRAAGFDLVRSLALRANGGGPSAVRAIHTLIDATHDTLVVATHEGVCVPVTLRVSALRALASVARCESGCVLADLPLKKLLRCFTAASALVESAEAVDDVAVREASYDAIGSAAGLALRGALAAAVRAALESGERVRDAPSSTSQRREDVRNTGTPVSSGESDAGDSYGRDNAAAIDAVDDRAESPTFSRTPSEKRGETSTAARAQSVRSPEKIAREDGAAARPRCVSCDSVFSSGPHECDLFSIRSQLRRSAYAAESALALLEDASAAEAAPGAAELAVALLEVDFIGEFGRATVIVRHALADAAWTARRRAAVAAGRVLSHSMARDASRGAVSALTRALVHVCINDSDARVAAAAAASLPLARPRPPCWSCAASTRRGSACTLADTRRDAEDAVGTLCHLSLVHGVHVDGGLRTAAAVSLRTVALRALTGSSATALESAALRVFGWDSLAPCGAACPQTCSALGSLFAAVGAAAIAALCHSPRQTDLGAHCLVLEALTACAMCAVAAGVGSVRLAARSAAVHLSAHAAAIMEASSSARHSKMERDTSAVSAGSTVEHASPSPPVGASEGGRGARALDSGLRSVMASAARSQTAAAAVRGLAGAKAPLTAATAAARVATAVCSLLLGKDRPAPAQGLFRGGKRAAERHVRQLLRLVQRPEDVSARSLAAAELVGASDLHGRLREKLCGIASGILARAAGHRGLYSDLDAACTRILLVSHRKSGATAPSALGGDLSVVEEALSRPHVALEVLREHCRGMELSASLRFTAAVTLGRVAASRGCLFAVRGVVALCGGDAAAAEGALAAVAGGAGAVEPDGGAARAAAELREQGRRVPCASWLPWSSILAALSRGSNCENAVASATEPSKRCDVCQQRMGGRGTASPLRANTALALAAAAWFAPLEACACVVQVLLQCVLSPSLYDIEASVASPLPLYRTPADVSKSSGYAERSSQKTHGDRSFSVSSEESTLFAHTLSASVAEDSMVPACDWRIDSLCDRHARMLRNRRGDGRAHKAESAAIEGTPTSAPCDPQGIDTVLHHVDKMECTCCTLACETVHAAWEAAAVSPLWDHEVVPLIVPVQLHVAVVAGAGAAAALVRLFETGTDAAATPEHSDEKTWRRATSVCGMTAVHRACVCAGAWSALRCVESAAALLQIALPAACPAPTLPRAERAHSASEAYEERRGLRPRPSATAETWQDRPQDAPAFSTIVQATRGERQSSAGDTGTPLRSARATDAHGDDRRAWLARAVFPATPSRLCQHNAVAGALPRHTREAPMDRHDVILSCAQAWRRGDGICDTSVLAPAALRVVARSRVVPTVVRSLLPAMRVPPPGTSHSANPDGSGRSEDTQRVHECSDTAEEHRCALLQQTEPLPHASIAAPTCARSGDSASSSSVGDAVDTCDHRPPSTACDECSTSDPQWDAPLQGDDGRSFAETDVTSLACVRGAVRELRPERDAELISDEFADVALCAGRSAFECAQRKALAPVVRYPSLWAASPQESTPFVAVVPNEPETHTRREEAEWVDVADVRAAALRALGDPYDPVLAARSLLDAASAVCASIVLQGKDIAQSTAWIDEALAGGSDSLHDRDHAVHMLYTVQAALECCTADRYALPLDAQRHLAGAVGLLALGVLDAQHIACAPAVRTALQCQRVYWCPAAIASIVALRRCSDTSVRDQTLHVGGAEGAESAARAQSLPYSGTAQGHDEKHRAGAPEATPSDSTSGSTGPMHAVDSDGSTVGPGGDVEAERSCSNGSRSAAFGTDAEARWSAHTADKGRLHAQQALARALTSISQSCSSLARDCAATHPSVAAVALEAASAAAASAAVLGGQRAGAGAAAAALGSVAARVVTPDRAGAVAGAIVLAQTVDVALRGTALSMLPVHACSRALRVLEQTVSGTAGATVAVRAHDAEIALAVAAALASPLLSPSVALEVLDAMHARLSDGNEETGTTESVESDISFGCRLLRTGTAVSSAVLASVVYERRAVEVQMLHHRPERAETANTLPSPGALARLGARCLYGDSTAVARVALAGSLEWLDRFSLTQEDRTAVERELQSLPGATRAEEDDRL